MFKNKSENCPQELQVEISQQQNQKKVNVYQIPNGDEISVLKSRFK